MWETPFDESMLSTNEKLIIFCPQEDLAEDLMEVLARNGITWYANKAPEVTRWGEYGDETCYWVESKILTYGDRQCAEEPDYTGHIKCTFLGIETQQFDIASDDELRSLLGL